MSRIRINDEALKAEVTGTLFELVRTNPGIRTSELAVCAGLTINQVRRVLHADKHVAMRMAGQGRRAYGTWHVV